MRQRLAWVFLYCVGIACSDNSGGGTPDGGPKLDAGVDPSELYSVVTLDGTEDQRQAISLAVGPNDRVGVAYFSHAKEGDVDVYDVNYLEWANGTVTGPETVRRVRRIAGLSLAFAPSGQPAVAFLGGDDPPQAFWFQSDAAVAYRQANGTWQEKIAVRTSGEGGAATGVSLNDNGFLVGLWPALAFDGNQAWLAYRDCHNGQAPIADWASSDLEVTRGGPDTWQTEMALRGAAGTERLGFGGHIQMVMVNGQPSLITDSLTDGPDTEGKDIYFSRRNAEGAWTFPPKKVVETASNQLGGSLAYDASAGYGVAVVDRGGDRLIYVSSNNGGQTWSFPDDVFQEGTGGWYPSLAFDPANHDPSIAYYICSRRAGANESQCVATEDEIRVATRIDGNWREERVTAEGGTHLKLAYLSNNKPVVAFRSAADNSLKLAVRK